MPAYAKRSFRRKASRPVKRVPRKRSGGRKAIAKIVKSIISRQAENKCWFDYGANIPINTASSNVPVNKDLLPQVNQGVGHSGRIGNEIRVKSAVIRGHVNLLPYNSTTNPAVPPLFIKMWLVSCKRLNTHTLSSTTIASDFFDIVNSSVGLQGNMLDINFTINKDAWTCVAQKSFKIGGSYTSATVGQMNGFTYFDNSPMSVPFTFNYGKYIKNLKYDDSSSSPTNKNLFIIFQAVTADGTSGFTTYQPAEFHYITRVEYEDI